MKKLIWLLAIISLPVFSDVATVFPKLDRKVQVATGAAWPDRLYIRWRQDNGSWFCTYIDRQLPRHDIINSSPWLDVELYALMVPSPQNLLWNEKAFCFSW